MNLQTANMVTLFSLEELTRTEYALEMLTVKTETIVFLNLNSL